MFETLDVISVNVWQLLVSLVNLVLLYGIINKFLYRPVKQVLSARERSIRDEYDKAAEAKAQALADKDRYEQRLSGAKAQADGILQSAVAAAKQRENEILSTAKEEAALLRRRAEEDAEQERKKAERVIKEEIVDVSAKLTEKLLGREMNMNDHEQLIDAFIRELE